MNRKTLLGAILLLALLIGACAPSPSTPAIESPVVTDLPTMEATEAPATEAPLATETSAATEAATEAPTTDMTATSGVPVTGAATVNVSELGTFGPALTDGSGRALYLFTNDTQNSGTSSCTGDCLVNWPPLLTDGEPVAGAGVDASMLGTITLADGTTQVTYNGWPLYYYAEDTAAGDTNGQGVGDVWYLVSPTGSAIQ